MVQVEELSDSEDEAPAPPKPPPFTDLNDMLKQAAELKSHQLKEKRRMWDTAPDWFKNTMGHERQGEVMELRENKPVAEQLLAAVKYKEEGNACFQEGNMLKAVEAYVKGVALFTLFIRDENKENVRLSKPYEAFPAEQRCQAEQILSTCFTNIAQCLLKTANTPPHAAIFAANLALELNPENAKALYRRAMGHVAEDTSTSLELAAKDLERAVKLAPEDKGLRAAFRKHAGEHQKQKEKDKQTYGGMLNKAPVYTKQEHAKMKETAAKVKQAPDPFDAWFKGVPPEEAKRRAKMVGIDLDNPKTRKALEAKARKHQEMDLQRKAKEMGIDLNHPDVKQYMQLLEKEKELEGVKAEWEKLPLWRRMLVRAFDPKRSVNFQNVCYALILLNGAVRMYSLWSKWPGSKEASEVEEQHLPWSRNGEF